MTEVDWLTCADPQKMLAFLGPTASGRKLRLFACACCYRIQYMLEGEWEAGRPDDYRRAMQVAERYADGLVTADELTDAYEGAGDNAFVNDTGADPFLRVASLDNADAAIQVSQDAVFLVGNDAYGTVNVWEVAPTGGQLSEERRLLAEAKMRAAEDIERGGQAALLRDLFGPMPLSSLAVVTAWVTWNDGTIPKIARAIYDERAFERMPILADALEDAGCDNADILNHCRSGGEHVRGCWVVDLLLGKQ